MVTYATSEVLSLQVVERTLCPRHSNLILFSPPLVDPDLRTYLDDYVIGGFRPASPERSTPCAASVLLPRCSVSL